MTNPLINSEQVRKVANLTRLEMTEEEEEQFVGQLSSILEYFQQLSELDTENVPPTTRAIDVSNVTRPDNLKPYPDREAILKEAPDPDGDYFRVPKILSEE
ncbi:MAG: Asp-tRNA(Asn)/Glu-tRNA(Gln) amidotransferase subunit GatC [Symploca sp. SIO3C6]|uniref:Aspartyl/glutamyl-tRNA(Asn/Gln) amidotransferase subunit C n=1 Tax=Symploca sp. SIO1C4 TaxID=2607765 RepID=A0A6B3N9T8_9CYAN|nr:Asp-tRNA(Asn)/Glu-tRNA(Gln) amidotransferase subunit GatC [Symploca sp. SIO3C6]NER26834.1 Asp-tRNA(Asn)/Glu-tRNA(Gln) amidotransferase subunit GatC [Symploca sp. SIO1C4]NET05348.1 Asp-tRNA(Asn)/Glu-tRNA(Gln) amidotransferase subunit GatC [Symploca sp. SIO2B6]